MQRDYASILETDETDIWNMTCMWSEINHLFHIGWNVTLALVNKRTDQIYGTVLA